METNQGVGVDYRKKATAAEAAASVARADADSLRALLAARAENPGTGLGANEAAAAASAFSECITEYSAVAATADRLSVQTSALQSYVTEVCLK